MDKNILVEKLAQIKALAADVESLVGSAFKDKCKVISRMTDDLAGRHGVKERMDNKVSALKDWETPR